MTGTAEQTGLEGQVVHAAFEDAHIARDAFGQHVGHVFGQDDATAAGLLVQDMQTGIFVRALDGSHKAGTKTRHQLRIDPGQIARGEGTCQHHPAAAILQGLDGGEQFLLGLVLVAQKVHVFQQQHVQTAEALLEVAHVAELGG